MRAMPDVVVIGGGFYGLRIALHLRQSAAAASVVVLEKEPELMDRSSYVNQARVHGGYHYPRSILTAYRSRVNFPRFVDEFRDAVVDDFEHFYAISRRLSKVNARQFQLFCARVGAPAEPLGAELRRLFNPLQVEAAFRVVEPAFDSRVLRSLLLDRLDRVGGVEIRRGEEALAIRADARGIVQIETTSGSVRAPRVISAAYSGLNTLHRRSALPVLPLQHEVTEMALVRMPDELRGAALTVMDGPFFSVMPFPDRGLHTLSHVRYTPHHRWRENESSVDIDPHAVLARVSRESRFAAMRADATREPQHPDAGELAEERPQIGQLVGAEPAVDQEHLVVRVPRGEVRLHSAHELGDRRRGLVEHRHDRDEEVGPCGSRGLSHGEPSSPRARRRHCLASHP